MLSTVRGQRALLAVYSANTLDQFIDESFKILHDTVSCEYVSAIYQRAGDGLYRERDSKGRIWSGEFMRRYVELTPAIPFVLRNPGVPVISTRDAMPGSESEILQSPFYREVMQRQGWRHAAVLCFWIEPPVFPVLVLSALRSSKQSDFSRRDLNRFERLHPFLSPAVTRLRQASISAAVSKGVSRAMRLASRGVIVVDSQLTIVCCNPRGRQALGRWHGSPEGGRKLADRSSRLPPVLAAACNRVGRLVQTATRRTAGSAPERHERVHGGRGSGLAASVTAMCGTDGIGEPCFVIEFDDHVAAATGRIAPVLAMLTRAERDVALAVAEGLSNKEAAAQLGKTLDAVKFLLHRAYKKLGTSNRTQTALLLGRHNVRSV
jgi:DNA-binding CsgD family transcriptional regulator